MSKTLSAVGVAAVCVGAVVLPAVEAWADLPDEGGGSRPAAVVPHDPSPPNYPQYDPRYEVSRADAAGTSVDNTATEVVQASASALAGAGVACGVIWMYRRRHAPAS